MGWHGRRAGYAEAPGSRLMKIVPATRMPPGDGDERRRDLAKQASSARPYVASYRAAAGGTGAGGSEAVPALLQGAVDAENELRKKFAQERSHPDLADPYVGLLPVHWCDDLLRCRELAPQESALPKVFPLASRRQGLAMVARAEFEENFELFTEGLLRNLNWDNVFAAGGSVLAALLPVPEEHRSTRQGKRKYYHHEAYTASDVDLFFYGLDEVQGSEKLKEVYYCICDAFPDPSVQPLCFRTQHAVTIVSKFPYRHIQVVLRLYKSPAEVLAGFDVDSCSVGFDGSNVWMTPRCHNSITAQYNTVDMTRRSPTYEVRLAKYAARGIEVAVPMLDRRSVDPQIYETPFEKTKGLTKLLLLEKLSTPAQRLQYKQQQRVGRLQPLVVRQGRFYNLLQQDMRDAFLQAQIDASQGDVSDYQTVFLPWGPNWDANKVRNLVYTKDMLLNSTFVDPFRKGFRHPCFFGSAAEVLEDCGGEEKAGAGGGGRAEEEEEEDPKDSMVSGRLKWMTVDPGQQSIGSFHPITVGEWAEGVHLSSATEHLVAISQDCGLSAEAAAAAVAAISPAIDGSTINKRDAAGRTPLMLAVLAGNAAAAQAFIERGALLNARLQDGRTALHLAAQYGKAVVIPPLLERGRVANAALGEHLKKMEQEERGLAEKQVEEEAALQKLREQEGANAFFRALHVLRRRRVQEAAKRSAEREEQGYLDKLDLDGLDYDQKMTPLMYAAFFGHGAVVIALLDAQADPAKMLVYEQNGMVRAKHALLTLACHNGHSGVFQSLLERRAPAGAEADDDSKRGPLHYAALWGEAECARLLLEPREEGAAPAANPDALDQSGNTALMLAVQLGHVKVVELLLGHTGKLGALGADAAKAQRSPVVVAAQAKQAEVLRVLLQSRGDVNAVVGRQQGHFGGGGHFGAGGHFGGGGLFGGGGGLFGHQARGRAAGPESTLLDWTEEQLANAKAELEQMRSSGKQAAKAPPHVQPAEYFDFLLGRTPGGFQRFALAELKRQVEEAAAEGPQPTHPAFSPFNHFAMMGSQNAGAQTEKQIEQLGALMKVLQEFGAKHQSELKAAAAAARSKSAPAARRGDRGRKPARRAASPQAAGGGGASAFQLGVGGPGDAGAPSLQALSLSYTEHFEPILVPRSDYPSLDSEVGTPSMQPRYKALFDAAVAEDAAAVQALCDPVQSGAASSAGGAGADGGGGPLLAAVRSSMLQLTLLEVAVVGERPEMVRCLLRLAARQFTPEPGEEEAADEEVHVKDAQLVQLGAQESTFSAFAQASHPQLMQLKETQSFKRKGHKMLERLAKYKAESQGAGGQELDQPLSVCSISKFISGDGKGVGALRLGVQRRCYAAVEALLDELDALDVLVEPGEEPSQSPAPAPGGPPPTLKSVLLSAKAPITPPGSICGSSVELRSMQLTAFEVAIACDDVRMAELLLARGARDCLRGHAGQELPALYTGLEVAGERREDWALPRRLVLSRAAVRRERLQGLHVAAAFGAERSIEFLLEGGLDAFAMVGDPRDESNAKEELVCGSLFTLEDRDAQGQTPLHRAIRNGRAAALRKLLAVGSAQMKEQLPALLNYRGVEPHFYPLPLHLAVASPEGLDAVSALLQYKASVLAADGSRHTALHVAASLAEGSEEAKSAKAAVVDALLDAAGAAGSLAALLTHAECDFTPLHWAVKHQSLIALQAMLKRVSGLGEGERRSILEAQYNDGRTALHNAVQVKGPSGMALVQALLAAGADVAARDGAGSTPLHLAAKAGADAQLLAALLPPAAEGGAAVGVEDAAGRTPLEWLMASQLSCLAGPTPIGGSSGAEEQPRASESLALLARAEAAGRKVVDPSLVRQHTNAAAAAAAAASTAAQPQAQLAEEGEEDEDGEGSDES